MFHPAMNEKIFNQIRKLSNFLILPSHYHNIKLTHYFFAPQRRGKKISHSVETERPQRLLAI
jgi:hypothetical protein